MTRLTNKNIGSILKVCERALNGAYEGLVKVILPTADVDTFMDQVRHHAKTLTETSYKVYSQQKV